MREKNCLGQISEELRERREKVRKEKKERYICIVFEKKGPSLLF